MKHLFVVLFLTLTVGLFARNEIKSTDEVYRQKDILTVQATEDSKIEAPSGSSAPTKLVDKRPQAGSVKKRLKSISFGTTEWTLSNDVVVVFRPTEFKENEIAFEASSWGGYSKVSTSELPSAYLINDVMKRNGFDNVSYADIQKQLSGKSVNLEASMSELTENLKGRSSAQDFETLLQLIYLNFQKPYNKDEANVSSTIDKARTYAANRANNTQEIFADSVMMKWNMYDKRCVIFDEAMLKDVSYHKVLDIFNKRFSAANDFTFVFIGNIDPEDANIEKLICTWLGSLPKGRTEDASTQAFNHPKGAYTSRFGTKVGADVAVNTLRYYAPMEYSWANLVNMHIIEYIAKYRCMEKAKGATPLDVKSFIDKYPTETGVLSIQFNCNPKAREAIVRLIKEEVKRLIKEGASSEDFIKAKETMLDKYDADIQDNRYWASSLVRYYLYGKDYINDYRNWIDFITLESIRDTLDKLVVSENIFEVSMQKEK